MSDTKKNENLKDSESASNLNQDETLNEVCKAILNLQNPAKSKIAIFQLLKYRVNTPDLACYLWYSYGSMSVILLEIVSIYPALSNGTVTVSQSHHICGCLTLLQCIVSHPKIKHEFIKAFIPLYLYPFLNTPSGSSRANDFLRLTTLGVLGAMVKGEDPVVLDFLLESDIIPLCIKIMESFNDLLRHVSTFIVLKFLLYDKGLALICDNSERFYSIISVLRKMIETSGPNISARLFKHVIRCFLRLGDNPMARATFHHTLPACLISTFETGIYNQTFKQDPAISPMIATLLSYLPNNQ